MDVSQQYFHDNTRSYTVIIGLCRGHSSGLASPACPVLEGGRETFRSVQLDKVYVISLISLTITALAS